MRTPEIRPGIRRLFHFALRHSDREADDEIRLHLQLRAEQLVREGWTPDAARAEAERRFGPFSEERDRLRRSVRRRDARFSIREWLDGVRQDIRYTARTLRRDAAFTTFAILIVGLGIGAATTVFSLVNGVLLRALPFRDPNRLVWVSNIGDDGVAEWRLQVSHFRDLVARSQSLDGLAGYFAYYSRGDATVTSGSDTQRFTSVPVTCNFFSLLGVTPAIGRSFADDECLPGGRPTVLLANDLWRRQFAADAGIVGRTRSRTTPISSFRFR